MQSSFFELHSFHIFGALSTIFFLLSLSGVFAQIQIILKRKLQPNQQQGFATRVLSLNTFAASFLGYYAFFIYGISLTPRNAYLVWPRLIALVLVIWILFEIARDRRTFRAIGVYATSLSLLLAGLVAMLFDFQLSFEKRLFSQWLTVVVTVIIAQGYAHQIYLMYKSRSVGAVSKRMHQLTLLKDIFTVAFGISMGLEDGWPLLLLSGVSGMTKIVLLALFYTLSRSDVAQLG
jgi:hypothetical protein